MRFVAPNRTTINHKSFGAAKAIKKTVRIVDLERFIAWMQQNDLDLELDDALEHLSAACAAK